MTREKKIYLHLTENCNLNCRHCYLGNKNQKRQLTWQQINTALTFFRKQGFNVLELTGGEPRLSPFWQSTIKQARQLGYKKIGLSTNGTDSTFIQQLSPKNIDTVTFSLDGSIAVSNDFIRGPGHFDKCLKNIKTAVENGLTVNVVTCVNPKNLDQIDEMITLLDNLKVNRLSFNFISPAGNADNNPELSLSFQDQNNFRKKIEKLDQLTTLTLRLRVSLTRNGNQKLIKKRYPCPLADPQTINIFPDGRIFYCCLIIGFEKLESGLVTDREVIMKNDNERNQLFGQYPNSTCPAQELIWKKNWQKKPKLALPICVYYKKFIRPKQS